MRFTDICIISLELDIHDTCIIKKNLDEDLGSWCVMAACLNG